MARLAGGTVYAVTRSRVRQAPTVLPEPAVEGSTAESMTGGTRAPGSRLSLDFANRPRAALGGASDPNRCFRPGAGIRRGGLGPYWQPRPARESARRRTWSGSEHSSAVPEDGWFQVRSVARWKPRSKASFQRRSARGISERVRMVAIGIAWTTTPTTMTAAWSGWSRHLTRRIFAQGNGQCYKGRYGATGEGDDRQ